MGSLTSCAVLTPGRCARSNTSAPLPVMVSLPGPLNKVSVVPSALVTATPATCTALLTNTVVVPLLYAVYAGVVEVAETSAVGSRNQIVSLGLVLARFNTSLAPPSMLTTALAPPIASTKALLNTTWLACSSCVRLITSMLLTCGVTPLKFKVAVLTTKLSMPIPPSIVSVMSNTTWSLPVPASMLSAPAPPSITSDPAPADTVSLAAPPTNSSEVWLPVMVVGPVMTTSIRLSSTNVNWDWMVSGASGTQLSKSTSVALTVTASLRVVFR